MQKKKRTTLTLHQCQEDVLNVCMCVCMCANCWVACLATWHGKHSTRSLVIAGRRGQPVTAVNVCVSEESEGRELKSPT